MLAKQRPITSIHRHTHCNSHPNHIHNNPLMHAVSKPTPPIIQLDITPAERDAELVGFTFVSEKPRYQAPMSVSFPALFRNGTLGPTLETLERKAPK